MATRHELEFWNDGADTGAAVTPPAGQAGRTGLRVDESPPRFMLWMILQHVLIATTVGVLSTARDAAGASLTPPRT
jgi:hypothetical protein